MIYTQNMQNFVLLLLRINILKYWTVKNWKKVFTANKSFTLWVTKSSRCFDLKVTPNVDGSHSVRFYTAHFTFLKQIIDQFRTKSPWPIFHWLSAPIFWINIICNYCPSSTFYSTFSYSHHWSFISSLFTNRNFITSSFINDCLPIYASNTTSISTYTD